VKRKLAAPLVNGLLLAASVITLFPLLDIIDGAG
jgi:hypothetical protein